MSNSCYLSKKIQVENNEWQLIEDNLKIVDIEIGGKNNYIMSGISFWTKEESQKIRRFLEKYVIDKEKNCYWDDIIKDNIKDFFVRIIPISKNDIIEIDTFEELKEVDSYYKKREFEVERILMDANFNINNVRDIKNLGGMTNKNYLVTFLDKKYVLRHSETATKGMLDRFSEAKNSKLIRKLNIDVNQIYYNEETGDKISEYIENAETLNNDTAKLNFSEVANILRQLHTSEIIFQNEFNVFDEIRKYEKLIYEAGAKFYEEYENVKRKIKEIEGILKKLNINLVPCHNDTVPENFLRKDNKIYLIDWEYSGMNDPMWDLAAFSLENELTNEEEISFFECYFNGSISKENYQKVQIFKILQDFLWSLWTILKEAKGVSFGNYGIKRFKRCQKMLEGMI